MTQIPEEKIHAAHWTELAWQGLALGEQVRAALWLIPNDEVLLGVSASTDVPRFPLQLGLVRVDVETLRYRSGRLDRCTYALVKKGEDWELVLQEESRF